MFGFTPDTELRNDMRALVGSLLEGNSFPGKVPLAAALHHFASSCGLGYLASVVFFQSVRGFMRICCVATIF